MANAPCRSDCSLPRCGDRILNTREGCDDGNRLSLDGCSSLCTIETLLAGGAFPTTAPLGTFTLGAVNGPIYVRLSDGRVVPLPPSGQIPPGAVLLGQIQPITTSHPPAGDTGPAAASLVAAGAASGIAYIRRKRRP
jgi:cysteine-rich repeat protein